MKSNDDPKERHFGKSHPLASVARTLCEREHKAGVRVDLVACHRHWEEAIRLDERVLIEEGLPRVWKREDTIDDMVIDKALKGALQWRELNGMEREVVIRKMLDRGDTQARMSYLLRTTPNTIRHIVDRLQKVAVA